MKYFTKYLPVEGEITENDDVFTATGIRCKGDKPEMFDAHHLPLTKVKLFLCSRDIQVGDKYYNEAFEFTKYPNESVAGSSTKWVGENGSYKVIGEVSPEAVWVKEGMEFDESQIDPLIIAGIKSKLKLGNRKIRIKCSQCNTFH